MHRAEKDVCLPDQVIAVGSISRFSSTLLIMKVLIYKNIAADMLTNLCIIKHSLINLISRYECSLHVYI